MRRWRMGKREAHFRAEGCEVAGFRGEGGQAGSGVCEGTRNGQIASGRTGKHARTLSSVAQR